MIKFIKFKKFINKALVVLVAASLTMATSGVNAAQPGEAPESVYTGIGNTDVILNNLDYSDIRASSDVIKDAVYETGVLGLVKGYGSKNFGLSTVLSREDVLGAIYTAIAREEEAQKLGQNLNNTRLAEQKKTNPISIWNDGFLQLALNDGLISQQDYTDAMEPDQAALEQGSFNRYAAASRQEVAYWIAKALKMEPVYNQQNVFNSFRDWKNADSDKLPYIEAALQNSIMTGDSNGYFRPGSAVNRGQLAQIIKNAGEFILPLYGFDRKTGTIEETVSEGDYSKKNGIIKKTFNVRNSNGMLHTINVEYPVNVTKGNRNENSGDLLINGQKDIPVFKNGVLGKSSLLNTGDRIEYITTPDNTVRYVNVISSVYDTKYYVAKVNKIDNSKRAINASVFFRVDYPDIDLSKANLSFDLGSENAVVNYIYSNKVAVLQDKKRSEIKSITPGMYVILTVKNNIVAGIKTFSLSDEEENNVVQGIVEDNNPQLGYITLYSEDGTGISKAVNQQMSVLRTFNYANQNELEAFKNHSKADVEDVETGDTVFLKLDSKGNVESLSAVDNYTVRYGKILSKNGTKLGIRFDNGSQQVLDADKNIPVLENKKLVSYNSLKNGDRVRLLLSITNKATKIKEITKEGGQSLVTNIYKCTVDSIDKTSERLVAWDIKQLYAGQWMNVDHIGAKSIRLSRELKVYFDNKEVSLISRLQGEAYIAVQKDYGGEEKAILVSFRNSYDTEDIPYDDTITYAVSGTDEFNIRSKNEKIRYGEGTIIVKDGRLVSGNSILSEDNALVVANRSNDTGVYFAGVVQISNQEDINGVQLYIGNIQKIDKMKEFTVKSFSELKGLNWEFSNTPKTFSITQETRILDVTGVINQSDFVGYGDTKYINRTVYIVADGVKTLLVTTAPYGEINAKGTVYGITGSTIGEDGSIITEPNTLKLLDAKVYDLSKYMWVDSKDMTLNIINTTIILKGGRIIKPSDLRKGDKIRVIKKDSTEKGDTYIIIVGN